MAEDPVQTTQLLAWIDRIQAGDLAARDDLIRHTCGQLERITRRMLKGYPTVKRWDETADVLQNASVRLLRALQTIRPGSMREFFSLAILQIRRELLDLARHYYGPEGVGANHASAAALPPGTDPPEKGDKGGGDPSRLAVWKELHEKTDELPDDQKEVVGLLFYQGMTQVEAAQVIGVTVRTIQNRWKSAMFTLHEALKAAWADEGDQ